MIPESVRLLPVLLTLVLGCERPTAPPIDAAKIQRKVSSAFHASPAGLEAHGTGHRVRVSTSGVITFAGANGPGLSLQTVGLGRGLARIGRESSPRPRRPEVDRLASWCEFSGEPQARPAGPHETSRATLVDASRKAHGPLRALYPTAGPRRFHWAIRTSLIAPSVAAHAPLPNGPRHAKRTYIPTRFGARNRAASI